MSRRHDPSWIQGAETLFAACLWLFPKALREAHGEEMRQAFRDRCREVARGERSAFRVLALELFPDTLRSAGAEQLSATFGDEMRPRQYWALGLLCCAAVALLWHDSLTRYTLDLAFRAKYAMRNLSDARTAIEQEAQVRRLADSLMAGDSLQSRALAAYLYRSLYTGRALLVAYPEDQGGASSLGVLRADGDRATAAAAGVLAAHADSYPLSVAVQACAPAAGCDRAGAIRRLLERDPDNAFGWSLAFKWAAQHQDAGAMRQALTGMAAAHRYEDYQGRIGRDLFAATADLAPGDAELLASSVRRFGEARYSATEDFHDDVRYACTTASNVDDTYRSRWLDANPDARADCLRVAVLLADSTDLWGARWGWQQVQARQTEAQARAQAGEHLRDATWLARKGDQTFGAARQADGRWRDWQAAEWRQWATSWQPGDGQAPAMRRWLTSRGLPIHAPPDPAVSPP